MKLKLKPSYLVVFCLVFIIACKKKLTEVNPVAPSGPVVTNLTKETNNWIYDEMKSYYLWEAQMKTKAQTNLTLDPESYFDSLLVKPGEIDRFSWMQNAQDLANSLNGVSTALGIRNVPFYADNLKSRVVFAVAYALKDSPAEKAGLKRGDLITQVNGVDITTENYGSIMAKETLELTLGTYNSGVVTNSTKKVTATKAVIQTNPIQFDTILNFGSKKVGYLVYTQFLSSYDSQMRSVFSKFKAAGVNELVLDLRFNGGGYISSSNILSSLIVKNLSPNTLMSYQEWNSTQTALYKAQYGENVFKQNWLNESNNLKLQDRVYVLVSSGSASASELVINNLKPFMDVILVGDHTYGKNVGSISITDDQKRWDWGMQPIVLKTYNAIGQSDYGTDKGFLPNIAVNDNRIPFLPFGDVNETLLNAALLHMGAINNTNARNKASNTKVVSLLQSTSRLDNNAKNLTDMFEDKFMKKN